MIRDIIFTGILFMGLAVGGIFVGGRYELVAVNGGIVARMDRFTGLIDTCEVATGHCRNGAMRR